MMEKLLCWSLRTTALLVGWMGCIGSVIAMVIACVVMSLADKMADWIWTFFDKPTEFTESQVQSWIVMFCVITLVASVINFIASALLVLGTVKERHMLLIPWLVMSGLNLIVLILYYGGVNIMKIAADHSIISVLVSLISNCLTIAIYCIMWYAIYSHYKHLQIGRNRQQQCPDTGDDYTVLQKQ